MNELIEIEAERSVHHVAPAFVFQEDHFTDVETLAGKAVTRGDFGWVTGRYCQFDDGTNTAFNRNGNMFAPTDYIGSAAKTLMHTPMNMLHQRKRIVGTFAGTNIIDPHGALADQLADAAQQLPFPYIDSLAAFWKYHFKDDWAKTKDAFDQGAAFLSMECVADTVTCFTPGCPCDGKTYTYAGLKSPTYCDALNVPRARKRLNYPHYVGGALVIPPALPAWAKADITRMAASLEGRDDEAEQIYEAVAASASHLDPKEWEFVMAMLLAGAFSDVVPDLGQADYDRLFSVVTSPEFDEEARRKMARDAAAAAASAGELIAAGLAVVAKDTGRTLLIQRANQDGDPAGGMWEWPGGHIDPEDWSPLEAAKREWQEELGCALPEGDITGKWRSPNGVYEGFVYVVEAEAVVDCNLDGDRRTVLNPDDPDSDEIEVAAWWYAEHLADMPALRAECQATSKQWQQLLTDAPQSEGITQEAANYRVADTEGVSCATCCYFDSMGSTCDLVIGEILPTMVSDLYEPRRAGAARPVDLSPTRRVNA